MVYFKKYWILIDYMPFTNTFFSLFTFKIMIVRKVKKKGEILISVT